MPSTTAFANLLGASLLLLAAGPAAAANVALNGTASQSSTGFGGLAERAIDGNRSGSYFDVQSVSHTNNGDPDPAAGLFEFWEVALDQAYNVGAVLVFNRTDCCQERLDPFRVSLWNGTSEVAHADVDTFLADITGPSISGMSFDFGGTLGDRVRVQLRAQDYLHLAEVEVYDAPAPVPLPGAVWMLGSALLGGLGLARKRG